MRGILKRKFAEDDENPCYSSSSPPSSSRSSPTSSEWESDWESSSSANQDFTPHSPPSPTSLPFVSIMNRPKRARRESGVRFDLVTVFSFPRCQGFTSVPSHGGATLGMMRRHVALQRYTVEGHAAEQRHRRRQRLLDRRREERSEALKQKLATSGSVDQRAAGRLTADQVPDEHTDITISDAELEDGGFPQMYSYRQRQALLLAAGVKRIDKEEKRQLHALRLSREACGCDCQGFCEPETCACNLAGIKCQVDRFSFPCGCTKDGCGNTQGHIQFDSRRVQTHYIHTVMRLELEKRIQDETLSQDNRTGFPEDLIEYEDQGETRPVSRTPDKGCPFGFSMEEEGLPVTLPNPSFNFSPERPAVEENSCSSDMTESSGFSSDCDGGGCPNSGQNLTEVHGGLSLALSLSDSENNNLSKCRHTREPLAEHSTTTDSKGPAAADALTDNISRTSVSDYLDENANQATDFWDRDSLEGFPNTPSPTLDYSSSRYMDPSLSSDSDLEFFDSDYPSGPLHSSFKGHSHPDNLHRLQLFSSVHLPQSESSTYLLEALIGLNDPSPEQVYDNQFL